MVRALLIAAAAVVCGGAARAQAIDWGRAGGALFPGAAAAATPAPFGDDAAAPIRLPALDQPFQDKVATAAAQHGLDPKLLHALVIVESAYRPAAVSSAGAGGLTQLMPGTAVGLGVRDRFDPAQNLTGGAEYLARQMIRFGDVRLALAAYNAGPERVARVGGIPNISETRNYVAAVVDCYLALTAGRGARNSAQCRAPGAAP